MKPHMSMLSGKHDAAFDKAFLDMMPKHHHAAVEMAEQVRKESNTSRVRSSRRRSRRSTTGNQQMKIGHSPGSGLPNAR